MEKVKTLRLLIVNIVIINYCSLGLYAQESGYSAYSMYISHGNHTITYKLSDYMNLELLVGPNEKAIIIPPNKSGWSPGSDVGKITIGNCSGESVTNSTLQLFVFDINENNLLPSDAFPTIIKGNILCKPEGGGSGTGGFDFIYNLEGEEIPGVKVIPETHTMLTKEWETFQALNLDDYPIDVTWEAHHADNVRLATERSLLIEDEYNGTDLVSEIELYSDEPVRVGLYGTPYSGRLVDAGYSYIDIIDMDVELIVTCKKPSLTNLEEQWPHSAYWKPLYFVDPELQEYLYNGIDSIRIDKLPHDASTKSHVITKIVGTSEESLFDGYKGGGEYDFDLSNEEFNAFYSESYKIEWDQLEETISLSNYKNEIELPPYNLHFVPSQLGAFQAIEDLENKINAIKAKLENAYVGLNLEGIDLLEAFELDFPIETVTESLEIQNYRKHKVYLLDDCCKKFESDFRQTSDSFNPDLPGKDLEDFVGSLTGKLYEKYLSEDLRGNLDLTIDEDVPGSNLLPNESLGDFFKSKLQEFIVNSLGDEANLSVGTDFSRDMLTEFKFDEQYNVSKSIQNEEKLGHYTLQIGAYIKIPIPHTKDLIGDILYDHVSNNYFNGNDWGWAFITVEPVAYLTEISFTGVHSIGVHTSGIYEDENGLFSLNRQVKSWKQRLGNRIAWKLESTTGDNTQEFVRGLEVSSWEPLAYRNINSSVTPFSLPTVMTSTNEVRIAEYDYNFNPCGE